MENLNIASMVVFLLQILYFSSNQPRLAVDKEEENALIDVTSPRLQGQVVVALAPMPKV